MRRSGGSSITAALSSVPKSPSSNANWRKFCGAKHVLSCANGTDALGLGPDGEACGAGQAVSGAVSFTFAATAEVVAWFGATPVFVDVFDDTFNMDPASLEAGIVGGKAARPRSVGVIPVDLFGLPAAYDDILEIAAAHRMWVICDAAQSFGAAYKDRKIGTIGDLTTTSFFPANRSAAMATAARCSSTMTKRSRCCGACACMARGPTNTTMCASV